MAERPLHTQIFVISLQSVRILHCSRKVYAVRQRDGSLCTQKQPETAALEAAIKKRDPMGGQYACHSKAETTTFGCERPQHKHQIGGLQLCKQVGLCVHGRNNSKAQNTPRKGPDTGASSGHTYTACPLPKHHCTLEIDNGSSVNRGGACPASTAYTQKHRYVALSNQSCMANCSKSIKSKCARKTCSALCSEFDSIH